MGAATTVNGTLSLTSGALNLNGQTLNLGNAATISRAGGSLSTAPSFGSAVNVTYAQNGSSITTGAEIPTSSSVLNNLTVATTNGVTLGAAATVNGTLSLASNLTLGSNNLTLSASHAVVGTPSTSNHIVTNGSGYVTTSAAYSSAYTFPVGYNSSNYNPVAITPVSEIPTVSVAAISPALTNSLKAMWTIGGLTSASTTIAFPWNSTTDAVGTAQRGGMVYSYVSSSWGTAIDGTGTSGTSPNYTTSLNGVAIADPSTFTVGAPSAATLALTSEVGTDVQSVNTSTSITNIVYEWSGSATTASISWTGTANSSTRPTGITVVIDNVNNEVTISGKATVVGNYGFTVLTDGSPAASKSGTISVATTATVTVATISAVTAGNIFPGSINNVLTSFSVLASGSSATITSVSIPFNTTLAAVELSNYNLYYTTGTSFNTSTLLATVSTTLATSPISFTGFTKTIASGARGYFWLTTDLSNLAVLGHTLTAGAISSSNLGFSLVVNVTGTASAGGTQIVTNPIYYNVSNSDVSNVNNWGDNTDGSGLHPSNFTGSNATYNLNNGLLNTLTSTTTFSGSGSVLSIGSTAGLKINTGVTMTVSSATMTIISGGALTIAGTLINSGTVTNGTTSAKFIVNGTYQHNVDGGSVPTATWNTGSTLNVTGMAGTNIGQMNQNFYNIIWNCPSQSINANWTWRSNAIVIGGDIQILASGTTGAIKIIGLTDGLGTSPFNYTINGNVSISGNSYLSCNASSTVNLNYNITVNKNFTIYSGATYSFHAATSVQTQVLNIKGDFSNAGTITSNTATDNNTLNFNGSGTHVFNNTGTFTSTLSATTVIVNSGNNVLVSSAATIPGLNVMSGGTVTNNSTLSILFGLIDNGTITGLGTTVMAGTSATAQAISGTGTVTNFTLNNTGSGATVSTGANNLGITGVLTLQSGLLTTNGNLTFKSTSIANTGTLAPYGVSPNTGTISGLVTVERYIPTGYRAYRDMAAQLSGAGTIYTNWQEGGDLPKVTGNTYTSGTGIFITGPSATLANTGSNYSVATYTSGQPAPILGNGYLDYSINGNTSAYSYTNGSAYSAASGGYVGFNAITSTNVSLDPFAGYRVLVRGDRSFNLATTPIVNYYNVGLRMVNATTLRTKGGKLITGTVTYNTTNASGTTYDGATITSSAAALSSTVGAFNMITNPYVCPVKWGTGTNSNDATTVFGTPGTTGINGSYWYLNPTLGATGFYAAYNALSGGNTYPNYPTGNSTGTYGYQYIQPGQAFFVQNSSTSPQVVFTEQCKAASSTKTSVFGATKPLSKLYVGLLKEDSVSTYTQKDGAAVAFASTFGNTVYGPQDALKFGNATDNIYIIDKGKNLSIDGRLPATATDVLPIALIKMSGKNYKLVVNAIDFDANGYIPVLKDNYKGTVKELSLGLDTITFTVDTTITASFANRFSLGFKPTTLAVNSIVASATLNNKIATISWNTVGEKGVSRYEVEKSTDAKAFTKVAQATAKNTAAASYSATDNTVISSTYYRIKVISEVGIISYSNVAKLATNNSPLTTSSLYPNPLKGSKVLNVTIGNLAAGKYTVTITNVLGQKVHEEAINHQGGSASHAITITNTLAAGTYSVIVRDANNQSFYQSNISVQP